MDTFSGFSALTYFMLQLRGIMSCLFKYSTAKGKLGEELNEGKVDLLDVNDLTTILKIRIAIVIICGILVLPY